VLGTVTVQLSEFHNNRDVVKTYPLNAVDKTRNVDAGSITLQISFEVDKYNAGTSTVAIFSVPLSSILERPENNGLSIPKFIHQAMQTILAKGIDSEGIFRLSGHAGHISELKMQIDSGIFVDLDKIENVHDLSGLFKLFFRELPDPLLTYEYYDEFSAVLREPKEKHGHALSLIIPKLPLHNRVLLEQLTLFLIKISNNSAVNKMTISNLSIVFGPNLLRNQSNDFDSMTVALQVMSSILDNYSQIFSLE